MLNNCPTAKWCSWKDVPKNVKKLVMDEILMSELIRSRKAVTTAPHSIPPPPTAAATAPAEMDPRPTNSLDPIGPRVFQVRCQRHQPLQWCYLLAPGVVTFTPTHPTRHCHLPLMPRGHNQVKLSNSHYFLVNAYTNRSDPLLESMP
ncbi:hypothetical protein C1H46_019703 [Malus baccata]|uniref:Uncharacterized protein n=1 Tax=Malus baccata TaxID=106549 RepID=A0A540M7B9_MALBA|nr:hypothetical protein C1H46_019703 [Malus baccata]